MLEDEIYRQARGLVSQKLGKREYSGKDLRKFLVQKGFSAQIAEAVVDEFVQKDWISDERYSRMLVRYYATRNKGPAYISQKLREKGIQLGLETIEQWSLELTEVAQDQRVRDFILRRYPTAWKDPKMKNKAYQALLRKGFSSDVIREAFNIGDQE